MSHEAILFDGSVRHRRFAPLERAFRYGVYMTYLDLDDVESSLGRTWLASSRRAAPVRFRRRDYLAGLADPRVGLAEAVRREVERQTGSRPAGPVRLLTHLRTWGVSFNPVSFYYCFAADGSLQAIVVEITNTPWDERHAYVLDVGRAERRGDAFEWRLGKEFHVSPFLPMDMAYRWTFTPPGERLVVHMENRPAAGGAADLDADADADADADGRASASKVFDATLDLRRGPALGTAALLRRQLRYPVIPALILYRIYRQAAEIWLRRVPFHSHPSSPSES